MSKVKASQMANRELDGQSHFILSLSSCPICISLSIEHKHLETLPFKYLDRYLPMVERTTIRECSIVVPKYK